MMTHKKEKPMPMIDAIIVAAIVAAFVIFGAVLAWAERQTRHLPKLVRQSAKPPKQQGSTII
jgi:hypothetical protein